MLIFLVITVIWLGGQLIEGAVQCYSLDECEASRAEVIAHMQNETPRTWADFNTRCEAIQPMGEFVKRQA